MKKQVFVGRGIDLLDNTQDLEQKDLFITRLSQVLTQSLIKQSAMDNDKKTTRKVRSQS